MQDGTPHTENHGYGYDLRSGKRLMMSGEWKRLTTRARGNATLPYSPAWDGESRAHEYASFKNSS